jgi:hypothetical protein
MEPDLKNIIEQFSALKQTFGWLTALTIITGLILLAITYKFIGKKVEKAAEVASVKSLKKFQDVIDREQIRFNTQHEKQIDALEQIYKHFEALSSVIKFTMQGEKFTQHESAQSLLSMLIEFRHSFKKCFQQNRLRLKSGLCQRIEALLPIVDEYIETFEGGIMPGGPPGVPDGEEPQELYIAAIWPSGLLDGIIARINKIAAEIENDFRATYGTAGQ